LRFDIVPAPPPGAELRWLLLYSTLVTSVSNPHEHVPWDRTPTGRVVLAVNGVALVLAATLVVWLVLDAGSVPTPVLVAGLVGLVLFGLNALVRLVVLLRNPDAFK